MREFEMQEIVANVDSMVITRPTGIIQPVPYPGPSIPQIPTQTSGLW